jgi:hypothetical protein
VIVPQWVDPKVDDHRRDGMAKAVAPYIHPRLAMIPHTGDSEKPTPMVARVEFVAARDGRPVAPICLPPCRPTSRGCRWRRRPERSARGLPLRRDRSTCFARYYPN